MPRTEDRYIKNIWKTSDEIKAGIARVGAQINEAYKDEDLTIITVLKGGANFSCALQEHLKMDCEIEYAVIKSYGPLGKFQKPVLSPIHDFTVKDKNVLIVEDLVDTGETMHVLWERILEQKPKSVAISVILRLPHARKLPVPHFCCFEEDPGGFLIGFGLDFTERQLFRNLPYIAVIKDEFSVVKAPIPADA
eukprot:Selendium_serpulae@DN2344_c0_g1_i1.p1